MKRKSKAALFVLCMMLIVSFAGCNTGDSTTPPATPESVTSAGAAENGATNPQASSEPESVVSTAGDNGDNSQPTVYMTTDISPESLLAIYAALDRPASGDNVAVKISTGEPGSHPLDPNLIKDLVQTVDGTIVECNTAYGGSRASTAYHRQLAADHGYTAIAAVDIQDEGGSISIPVAGGNRLSENLVGASFTDYDFYVILSHFKGHRMGGFGGAIKNMSVGIASSSGKCLIHSAGVSSTDRMLNSTPQDDFLETMSESAKSVADYLGDNILYINVMNNLSVDCDCIAYGAPPCMEDIGILASLDPVALDQACVDLIYAANGTDLIERMESRNAVHALEYAVEIGFGSQEYTLVSIGG